jgi:hypothetical protein
MTKNHTRVSLNIYRDGNSYRVVFQRNGKRTSKNFRTKKAAIEFRNKCFSKMKMKTA